MEAWKSQSNAAQQTALSMVCAVIGLVLIVALRNFREAGDNALAGLLLGVLLLVIGIAGVVLTATQTVVVDPQTRFITVQDSSLLRTQTRTIAFDDVVGISLGYLGKRANFVTWYYLILKLSNGQTYPLFAPGRFFKGGSNRSTVEGWKQRLEQYLA